MMNRVAISLPSCKRRVRSRASTVEREVAAERAAFEEGKDAAGRGTSPVECPFKGRGALAVAWLRGWTFEANRINGKRPLDTVRRKGAQEAGRP